MAQDKTRSRIGFWLITTAIMVAAAVAFYWVFWIHPYGALHTRAAQLLHGIPATKVSTQDGAATSGDPFIKPPATVVVYHAPGNTAQICAAIISNLKAQYSSDTARTSAPSGPQDHYTCEYTAVWGTTPQSNAGAGGVEYGVRPDKNGSQILVYVFGTTSDALRQNILNPNW
jgi:hypothetical protein